MFGIATLGNSAHLGLLAETETSIDNEPSGRNSNMMKSKIVDFLKSHREKSYSGKELEELIEGVRVDQHLSELLKTHSNIITDENGYRYQSVNSHLTDKTMIVKEVMRRPATYGNAGIPLVEISDCYQDVLQDVKELVANGELIAIDNTVVGEKSTTVLYPRGPVFGTLLEVTPTSLSSSSSLYPATSSSHKLNGSASAVSTSCDLTNDILPGEAIHVIPAVPASQSSSSFATNREMNHVCRVTSTRNGAKALPENSLSASASFNKVYSVSLEQTLGSNLKSGVQWTHPLTKTTVPIEGSNTRSLPGGSEVTLVRFGCSTDLRRLWKESGTMLPKDAVDLKRALKVKDEVKRPTKRPMKQKRKGHRIAKGTTNAHLD